MAGPVCVFSYLPVRAFSTISRDFLHSSVISSHFWLLMRSAVTMLGSAAGSSGFIHCIHSEKFLPCEFDILGFSFIIVSWIINMSVWFPKTHFPLFQKSTNFRRFVLYFCQLSNFFIQNIQKISKFLGGPTVGFILTSTQADYKIPTMAELKIA